MPNKILNESIMKQISRKEENAQENIVGRTHFYMISD